MLQMDATSFARELRVRSTDAERLMWHHLRARRLDGYKFKRQYPVGSYIADFVCLKHRLIVELDGSQHASSNWDRVRDQFLVAEGFEVIRIWNNDVFGNLAGVLEHILARVHARSEEKK
jgi:very-short-patch-repair endonuclease